MVPSLPDFKEIVEQNKLKIVDEVLTSTAHLIVNKKSLRAEIPSP